MGTIIKKVIEAYDRQVPTFSRKVKFLNMMIVKGESYVSWANRINQQAELGVQGPGRFWYRSRRRLSLRLSLSLRMSLSLSLSRHLSQSLSLSPSLSLSLRLSLSLSQRLSLSLQWGLRRDQLRISQWHQISKQTIQLQRRTLRRKTVKRRIWGMMREQNWKRKSCFWMKQWSK